MIKSFKNKKLKKLFNGMNGGSGGGNGGGLDPNHIEDLEEILNALDKATHPQQMNLPGYDFHPLKGNRSDTYSVHVNGPWCVTFKFEGNDATAVDYEQYH